MKYPAYRKTFNETLADKPIINDDGELEVTIDGKKYSIKITDKECLYYETV